MLPTTFYAGVSQSEFGAKYLNGCVSGRCIHIVCFRDKLGPNLNFWRCEWKGQFFLKVSLALI